VLAQAVEGGGSLTLHVDFGGRRCLVDLLLRAPFAGHTAADVAGRWLDGQASLTVLARGARAPPGGGAAHPPLGGAPASDAHPRKDH
jgi:hypothetical protein